MLDIVNTVRLLSAEFKDARVVEKIHTTDACKIRNMYEYLIKYITFVQDYHGRVVNFF